MHAMFMNTGTAGGASGSGLADNDDQEPDEFADSDTDPVWTPQDDDVSLCVFNIWFTKFI